MRLDLPSPPHLLQYLMLPLKLSVPSINLPSKIEHCLPNYYPPELHVHIHHHQVLPNYYPQMLWLALRTS